MIDGFKRFEPRGSPRGQGPPRFTSCIAVRRCLLLAEKVASSARRMRWKGCGYLQRHRYRTACPSRTLGSLVQRELAAARLTEGLTRSFLYHVRYLQPLRHGAEHRAASPYAGDVSLHPRQTLPYGACPPFLFLKTHKHSAWRIHIHAKNPQKMGKKSQPNSG